MIPRVALVFGLAALLSVSTANSQTPPTTRQSPQNHVLPELTFGDEKLEDVLNELRDQIPTLNVVVTRSDGIPQDFPKITLRARGLTLKQFIQFTTDLYEIEWKEIPGPEGTLYIVHVPAGDKYMAYMEAKERVTPPPPPPPQVFSYNLRPILDYLSANKPAGATRDERSLEEVMSLLQEALTLAQVPNDDPQFKVHAPTSTLLFAGSGRARGVVERVLATLKPPEQPAAPPRGGQASTPNASQPEGRSGRGQ